MKRIVHALAIILISTNAHAQLISKFTWESGNASTADYGPSPVSISSSAYVTNDGAGGTRGLNAGTGGDINLVLGGSSFMLPSLDISVDFRRKESEASFFKLGNFDFGMTGGSLYAKFRLVKGTGDTSLSFTNLYTLPSDNSFHTYRFQYISATGVATVTVDGTSYLSYTRIPASALSWTGAGNATIGTLMDGTNSNIAILDNVIIQNPGSSTLPLTLVTFAAAKDGNVVDLDWTSTREINTRAFIVERSGDGQHFEAIGTVDAKKAYSGTNAYDYKDQQPLSGDNYYRLKMVDQDGQYTYSSVRKLSISSDIVTTVSCYPNPVVDQINVKIEHARSSSNYSFMVYTLDGKAVQAGVMAVDGSVAQQRIDVSTAPKGMLVVHVVNMEDKRSETFKVFRN